MDKAVLEDGRHESRHKAKMPSCDEGHRDASLRRPFPYCREPCEMKSLWSDAEAANHVTDLARRVYTSQLLGRDASLVLHGGGNTSVKRRQRNLVGEEEHLLYVKGSGWDLETIQEAGFAPVRLEHLLKLAKLEMLSDPQMMNELVTNVTQAGAPAPSVEAILHAILPHKFVDHTHADAVLAVTNTRDGEKRIREIYGNDVVVIPYIMPGFDLAQLCARMFAAEAGPKTIGMVLMNHGMFSFGDTAEESYERMIALVARAEKYLSKQRAWEIKETAVEQTSKPLRLALASLRRELSQRAGFPMILATHSDAKFLQFRAAARCRCSFSAGPGDARSFHSHQASTDGRSRRRRLCESLPRVLRAACSHGERAQDHARSNAARNPGSRVRPRLRRPQRQGCAHRSRHLFAHDRRHSQRPPL